MKQKVIDLINAINIAKDESEKAVIGKDDDGTCNCDTCCIKLNRWTNEELSEAKNATGVRIGDKLSGFFNGYRFLSFSVQGQAGRRTIAAESAYKTLKQMGYDVYMWYNID